MASDLVTTSIQVPRDLQAEIQEYRRQTGITMVSIIRTSLRAYLDRQKQANAQEQQG